ncbi:hypothetical protein J6590_029394 [Homalodisca vitripennis]|nr:hypothetical protein J6590_029394 [Homalodisca vitripennis]
MNIILRSTCFARDCDTQISSLSPVSTSHGRVEPGRQSEAPWVINRLQYRFCVSELERESHARRQCGSAVSLYTSLGLSGLLKVTVIVAFSFVPGKVTLGKLKSLDLPLLVLLFCDGCLGW